MKNKEGLFVAVAMSIGIIIGALTEVMLRVKGLTLIVPSILVYAIAFIEVKLRKKELERFIPNLICAVIFDVIALLGIAYF